MMLIEETAPAAEALPIAALREHLRLGTGFEIADDTAEDMALAGFLRAAIATIEARTGKVLLTGAVVGAAVLFQPADRALDGSINPPGKVELRFGGGR